MITEMLCQTINFIAMVVVISCMNILLFSHALCCSRGRSCSMKRRRRMWGTYNLAEHTCHNLVEKLIFEMKEELNS